MVGRLNDAAFTVHAEQLTGSIVLIRARGEVDTDTAGRLRDVIMTQIDHKPDRLIIHLGGVTFMGSAGLGALVEAARRRPDLRLLVTNYTILRTLQRTELIDWFNVYESVSDALHQR